MSRHIDDIRRRHSERKQALMKEINHVHKTYRPQRTSHDVHSEQMSSNGSHPLFDFQKFITRLLTSIVLVLGVGVLYKQPDAFMNTKKWVNQSLAQEFNFAQVSAWYEGQFGKPLAFLPSGLTQKKEEVKSASKTTPTYAVPVTGGVVSQKFSTDGQGIYLKTNDESSVKAVQDGYVTTIETKDKIGKTVIIQHTDGTETWYGDLDKVTVKMYDFVKQGDKIGTVSKGSDQKSGSFYFAIKKGKAFIDPIQVINFD